MKIRRKSEKTTGPRVDGVPPLHTLITCTYQKLFKKDGLLMLVGSNGAPTKTYGGVLLGHGTSDPKSSHRQERGNSWRGRAMTLETPEGSPRRDEEEGPDDSPTAQEDLHEARNNPLLPKRRKVKSTRYAESSDKFSDEIVNVTPRSTKSEKRSRTIENAPPTGDDPAVCPSTAVASSKEALIASIFYVFDTLGTSGLTASEVVAIMLEQSLPGLKEGGARHTVQVANVLRRSRHFLSIGNKQYLPCAVSEDPSSGSRKPHGRHGPSSSSSSSRSKPERPLCKLYDGSGWFCPREAQTGLSLCAHHLYSINRPLQSQAPSPSLTKTLRPPADSPPRRSHSSFASHELDANPNSDDSDREDNNGKRQAPAKWGGRDRTPGSWPNQKRKMLSLCSIK